MKLYRYLENNNKRLFIWKNSTSLYLERLLSYIGVINLHFQKRIL